jgi:hypothetical protein
LINGNLVLESVVLDEGTVSGGVVIWFDFEVTPDSILFDNFGAVNPFFDVELLPDYHVLEILLLEVLDCQPVLNRSRHVQHDVRNDPLVKGLVAELLVEDYEQEKLTSDHNEGQNNDKKLLNSS